MKGFIYALMLLLASCDAAPVYTPEADDLRIEQEALKRTQKVIEQLQADCDSNLQRETYKRVLQLQQLKRQKRTR